jgi:endonuclease-3
MVTPVFFRRFPNVAVLAAAEQDEVEEIIRSTGFFRNKARNLIGMARSVCESFDGDIPDEMDDLLSLPGVARKTANCVLGTWFRKNVGVVVDTHVGRLASRLRLLTTARDDKDAVKIEQDLARLFPQDSWTYLSHALIQHGRQICIARKPRCDDCKIADDCPSAELSPN